MRYDPQALLRGFGKLLAVVLAAGLAGAVIGITLWQLNFAIAAAVAQHLRVDRAARLRVANRTRTVPLTSNAYAG